MESIISASGLVKSYGKFTLGELSFSIPKGFSTALIGANGAGKTTLIDILCGVIHATSGKLNFFGEFTDPDSPAVRERVGYCAAAGFFPTNWKPKNIVSSFEIAYKNFDREKFARLCEELGVESHLAKKQLPMYKLSDGNRMRTALAAVFARETDVLILDEPGSSLDPLMRDRLCDKFREYLDRGNGEKSVVFSTHNIADMENATDYAVFIGNGKILETGFVDDLKEKYIIVRGDPENFPAARELLLSFSVNSTTFEGLSYAENSDKLQRLGAVTERPSLQTLSVGLLKYAEGKR